METSQGNCSPPSSMRLLGVAAATALCIVASSASAIVSADDMQSRRPTTASERLGLAWLGGNSSLPKVL